MKKIYWYNILELTFLALIYNPNLVPRAISAFKMAGGREDPGEQQVTCLQKYWSGDFDCFKMAVGSRLANFVVT